MIRVLILTASVVVVACGDARTPTGVGPPATLLLVSGDGQAGTVGERLQEPLVVRVTDARGSGVTAVQVTFSVGEGDVALPGDSGTSEVTASTDADGRAAVTWTLGTTAGEHTTTASVPTLGPVTFRATAEAAQPVTLEKVSGDEQLALVGVNLPRALTVRARDRFGNAVPEVSVDWSLTGVAGRVPETVATTTDGEASATVVLEEAGDYQVTAEVLSVGAVTFTGTTLDLALAFISHRTGNGDIYVTDADGRVQLRLTGSPEIDAKPAWSPDGSRIAFMRFRPGEPSEIYLTNLDGTDERNLTNNPADDWWPSWSPDGGRIAFETNRDDNREIYVMNVASGFAYNVTNHSSNDLLPAWSPDGTKIAFATDRDGMWEIYVMNVDGSDQKKLTDDSRYDGDPAWSPDGRKMAFYTDRDGNAEIYVMDSDGTNLMNLTNHWAEDHMPDWSPDGSLIAFTSSREDFLVEEVYIMKLDGTGLRNLTRSVGFDGFPAWKP